MEVPAGIPRKVRAQVMAGIPRKVHAQVLAEVPREAHVAVLAGIRERNLRQMFQKMYRERNPKKNGLKLAEETILK